MLMFIFSVVVFPAAGGDYYGAIVTTSEQKFGKKQADKIQSLKSEAKNPRMAVSGKKEEKRREGKGLLKRAKNRKQIEREQQL